MRALGRIVGRDLVRQWRRPIPVLVLLSFPLVFAAMLQLAFGGASGPPKVGLLVEGLPEDPLGVLLREHLEQPAVSGYFATEAIEGQGRERLEEDRASALLVLPPDLTATLRAGETTTVELVTNPAHGLLPRLAELAAPLVVDGLEMAGELLSESVVTGAALDPLQPEAMRFLAPAAVELTVSVREDSEPGVGRSRHPRSSVFLLILPGISVYVLFLVGDHAMRDLETEVERGTLGRMLRAPIRTGEILAAKALTVALVVAASTAVVIGVGWAITRQTADVPGLVLQSVALVVAVTGLTALVHTVAGGTHQASTMANFVYLVLAFSGGSFVPLERLPGAMQELAPFSLFYWPTEGFKRLVLRSGGAPDVLAIALLLIALGAGMLIVSSEVFERRWGAGTRGAR